jgi:flavin-dependent dehydrogenase
VGEKLYDTAIIGGGLAGLSLSIQLSRAGHSVILFEKEKFPFHKVCGEYISLESWDFLNSLGVDLDKLKVPVINRLEVSSVSGKLIKHDLPLGGFGISRYTLDAMLAEIAKASGVTLLEETKVNDIVFSEDCFRISAGTGIYHAKTVAGCWGKRSNMDIKWKRKFSTAASNKLNNYIGVKYHVQADYPDDQIALHNFRNGYCGISKIENGSYNLCYMTTASNLASAGGEIKKMEKQVLAENPHLAEIFNRVSIKDSPVTISQVSFENKSLVENHVLMIGDAAGMITPLCGNGMSMAMHASKIAALHIDHFLKGLISREKMEKRYMFQWRKQFSSRLRMGRLIQRFFGKKWMTNMLISTLKPFPGLVSRIIRQTYGKTFIVYGLLGMVVSG